MCTCLYEAGTRRDSIDFQGGIEMSDAWKQLWNAVWHHVPPENVYIQWVTCSPSIFRCLFVCTMFTTVILYVFFTRRKA